MLQYLYGDQLHRLPRLRDAMFADRTRQFRDRLGWEVSVDAAGEERDEYDALNPLYVIWAREDGTHGGSMRFLPTTGAVMVNDHFLHLTHGVRIESPLIWECTRLCLAPGAAAGIAPALLLGAAELGLGVGLSHAVAVFDARMVRVYRALGWPPTVVGSEGVGDAAISVGLWEFSTAIRDRLERRAGLPAGRAAEWFEAAFGERLFAQVG